MLFRERSALKRAVTAEQAQTRLRHQAEEEAVKSQQVARFLKETLQAVGPAWAKGGDTSMLRDVLGRTADRVANELTNQPAVQAELRSTIGNVYQALDRYFQDLGDKEKTATVQLDLLNMRKTLFGSTNVLVADSLAELSRTLNALDRPEAESTARESLALSRKIFGNDHRRVADALTSLVIVLENQGKLEEAEICLREAVAIEKKAYGSDDLNVTQSLYNLTGCLWLEGKLAEAESMCRDILAMFEKQKQGEHTATVAIRGRLGSLLNAEGKLAEAEEVFRTLLAKQKKLAGDQSADAGIALARLADVLFIQGTFLDANNFQQADADRLRPGASPLQISKLAEAESTYREALAIFKKLGDVEEAGARVNLGVILQLLGKPAEAEVVLREALPLSRKFGDGDSSAVWVAGWNLKDLLREQGRLSAESPAIYNDLPPTAHHLKSLFLVEGMLSDLPREITAADIETRIRSALGVNSDELSKDATFFSSRGQVLARRGLWKEATTDCMRSISLDPEDDTVWQSLTGVLVRTGQLDLYREWCRKSVERFGSTRDPSAADRIAKGCLILPSSGADTEIVARMADRTVNKSKMPWALPWSQFCKGLSEYRQGHFTNSLIWMEKVLFKPGESSERDVEAYMVRAMACQKLNQADKAQAAFTRGCEIAETKLPRIEAGDLGGGWVDWIIAHALLREAADLCGRKAEWSKFAQGIVPLAALPGVAPDENRNIEEAGKTSPPTADFQSENLLTLKVRGDFFARHAHWKEAANDLNRAFELEPEDHAIWHALAAVLIQSGDVEGWRELCAKNLKRFADTSDSIIADRAAKDSLILPESFPDSETAARLADIAVATARVDSN